MSADDDTELRDLVIDSLEKKGVLGKIKAELRATVFLALEENDKDLADGNHLRNGKSQQELSKFLTTENGIVALSLVRDFLQQFELDFSLAVLDPEVSSPRKSIPRNELGSLLKLSPKSDSRCPLLGLLISQNQSTANDNHQDQNGNASHQVSKTTVDEYEPEKDTIDNSEYLKETLKKPSQPKANLTFMSDLPSEDPFFDDPLPATKNSSLFFNFAGKPSAPKTQELQPLVLSKLDETKDPTDNSLLGVSDDLSGGDVKKGFGLSSLRDLPALINEQQKPKEGRRQWKDTDPEQRERFMNLTFGSKIGHDDPFPSSLGGGDTKEVPGSDDHSDPVDQEPSIEENIEEDLSALADDLLNSGSSSSKDENVTLDKTVSDFSKAGGYDYMENLT